MPDPEDVAPYHFIAFVCKDGCLYELGESKITIFYFIPADLTDVALSELWIFNAN